MPFCRVSPRPPRSWRANTPPQLRTRQRGTRLTRRRRRLCRSPPAGPAPPPPACRGDGGESPCPAGRRRRRRPPRWPPPKPASPGGVSRGQASGGQRREIVHHKVEQEQLIQIDHRHPASPPVLWPVVSHYRGPRPQKRVKSGRAKKKLTRIARQQPVELFLKL